MPKLVRLLARLQCHANRPWYAPLVATSATFDYFILASPAQSLFMSTVLLNPARRVYAALCFSFGAALGALLLGASVQFLDAPLEAFLADHAESFSYWQSTRAWIDAWGPMALLSLSVIPVPLRTAVIIAAMVGLHFFAIGLMVFLGRLLALLIMGQIVYQTPRFLSRIPFVRRFAQKFSVERNLLPKQSC